MTSRSILKKSREMFGAVLWRTEAHTHTHIQMLVVDPDECFVSFPPFHPCPRCHGAASFSLRFSRDEATVLSLFSLFPPPHPPSPRFTQRDEKAGERTDNKWRGCSSFTCKRLGPSYALSKVLLGNLPSVLQTRPLYCSPPFSLSLSFSPSHLFWDCFYMNRDLSGFPLKRHQIGFHPAFTTEIPRRLDRIREVTWCYIYIYKWEGDTEKASLTYISDCTRHTSANVTIIYFYFVFNPGVWHAPFYLFCLTESTPFIK